MCDANTQKTKFLVVLNYCGKKVPDCVWNQFLIQFIIFKDLWLSDGVLLKFVKILRFLESRFD